MAAAVLLALSCHGNRSSLPQSIPSYYDGYLQQKAEAIRALQKDEADGFYFWTDSHFPYNAGHTADIIKYLCDNSAKRKVFFGGDATKNDTDLAQSMQMHLGQEKQIASFTRFYAVRGNHDFTLSTHVQQEGSNILSQEEVSKVILSHTCRKVVPGPAESGACYYYFDEKKAGIRYLVLDSTDSVRDGKNRYGIGEVQTEWVKDVALASLPEGWRLIVVVHVPLSKDQSRHQSLIDIRDLLPADSVLMVLSGHRHFDFQNYENGFYDIITACDTYSMAHFFGRSPFVSDASERFEGTLREQCFDYVSVSSDYKTIRMERIGAGNNRTYSLEKVTLAEGESACLSSSLEGEIEWMVYDGTGNATDNRENPYWIFSSTIVEIDGNGTVTALKNGEAIAVAIDRDGNNEYFCIQVR